MQRSRSKTIILKKSKEPTSTNITTPTQKRTVARICCLRLQTKWTIRNQFMSSILILNFIFLILIIVSILGTLIGLAVLLQNLTKEKIKSSQLESFKAWSVEKSEAISNKLGYYYTVNDYFGKLLQGMNMQDNSLFDYQVYPLNQPNSQDFTDLPQWGHIRVTTSAADQIEAYLQNTKALNYFAKSLLTSFEDIPIRRMYATFVDDTNKSILTLGYPNTSTFELPASSDENSLWYTDALRSGTSYSWGIAYDGDLPLFRLSRRFNKMDGSPLVVTCVELNLTLVQRHVLDQFNENTGNLTPTLILDIDGIILLASSDLGYSFLVSQPRVGQNGSFTEAEWVQVKSIAELQDGDVITWNNSNGEVYHISASKLNLPFDPNIDTMYVVHYYPDTMLLSSLDVLSNDIYDRTFQNVMISGLAVLGSFLIMAVLSCLSARSFLEPLKVISDFSFMKNAQTISKYDGEKEIKPLKLPDGSDEIGELMNVFKKLIQGFSYSNTDKEKELKKADKGIDTYPKNYFRGKAMPWREELKKLQPKLTKQVQKESTQNKFDGFIARLTRSNS